MTLSVPTIRFATPRPADVRRSAAVVANGMARRAGHEST
jgi:hypothetical protein